MDSIERCSRCIIPASLPSVELDENGVCNYCNSFDKKFSGWDSKLAQQKKDLEVILQKIKNMKCDYDCLIPLSGGKDSTYTLYLCDKIFGLKCLCITFDNGYLSANARKNIDNAIKSTNADHIFYKVNPKMMNCLFKNFIVKTGHTCVPCMRGIDLVCSLPTNFFKIPVVITGTGDRIAYLGKVPELFQSGDVNYFESVCKESNNCVNCGNLISDKKTIYGFKNIVSKGFGLLKIKKTSIPKHIEIYNYMDTDFNEIYDIIHREMGWSKDGDKFEHSDCRIDEIPFYIHSLKFPELTRHTFYHSNLIRLGQMTRENALEIETNALEEKFIPPILNEFLENIDMGYDDFVAQCNDWEKVKKYRQNSLLISVYKYLRKVNERIKQ